VLISYSSLFYKFNLSVNLCTTHNSTFQCSPNPYNILHSEGMRAYPFVFMEVLSTKLALVSLCTVFKQSISSGL
jgi:hypothetical protein